MNIQTLISFLVSVPIWATMAPIFVCSVIALAFIIERFIFYRRINYNYHLIMNSITEDIKTKDLNNARQLLKKYGGPIIEIIEDFLNNIDSKSIREITNLATSRHAISSIEKYVAGIATIATISPMLGLLGTVTGLLKGFTALYSGGAGPDATNLLMLGVAETLITTVLGLVVAIPSWVFYNYMVTRVEYFIKEIEYVSNVLIKSE
jgi:biopolymer transport protein ExbB